MRIRRLHIDGFGRFADRTFGPFERSVTVFLGPNEAGKSTLLEFVRRVFFGFPDGRSSSNPYPPLAGGRHGGSVTIVSEAGETVTVQRYQGAGGGPVGLTAASGGPLPEGELPRLLGQHSRDVFQNIFSFTLEELNDEALLKDDRVNAQIYSAGMGATKLPAALRALEVEKQSLFLKGGNKHKIIQAGNGLSKIEPTLRQVKQHAAKYGDLLTGLTGVMEELERLSGLRRKHQSKLDHQKRLESAWDDWNDLNQAEEKLAGLLSINDFPIDGISRLETLEERIKIAQEEYDSADHAIEEAKARAEAVVEHQAILNHTTEIRTLQEGRTFFNNAVRDLRKRSAELEDHEKSLVATLKDLGPDWDEARLEHFDLSLAVREDISRYQGYLRKTREELDRSQSNLTQNQTLLEEAIEAKHRAERELEAAVKPASRKNGSRVLPAICVAAGIALLAVGSVLGGSALPVGIAAGLALAGVAAYLFLSGLPFTDTGVEYARLSRDFDGARGLAQQRKKRVENSQKAVEEAERSLASVQREWRQWLADRDLRETFLPETVVELRGKVELGRDRLNSLRSHRQRIDAIRKNIGQYVAMAGPLASGFGVPFDRNESSTVAAAASTLIELHEEVDGRVKDRATAEDDLGKAKRRLAERDRALRKAEEEKQGLLQSGGADDAEDFRKRAEIVRQRTSLEEQRRGALGRLQRLSGPGEPLEALKKQLGDTDFQTIRHEKRLLEEKIEHADAEIRERSTQRGSIQTELRTLTGEEESSSLRAERHRLLEEMRSHAREWVIRVMAEKLLKEAQAKFEKERQPGVVRHAESFFKGITAGRYQSVFSPLGSSEIQVSDSSGVSRQPVQLSSGTRGQLFLSLRFGLIQELGQRSERLPVIVDEALVNFDPERGMRVARAFVELSRTNQVLVFTCHPTIVELFQNAAAKLDVQEPEVVRIG